MNHILLFLTALILSACSDAPFLGSGSSGNNGQDSSPVHQPKTLEQGQLGVEFGQGDQLNGPAEIYNGSSRTRTELCKDAEIARTTSSITLTFEPTSVCPWNQNGNEGFGDGPEMDARKVQSKQIDLTNLGAICSLSIRSNKSTPFQFDDTIHFTLENHILGGQGFDDDHMNSRGFVSTNGILMWDFSKIINSDYDRKDEYCSPQAECEFPNSDRPGTINLLLSEEWFHRIDSVINSKKSLDFSAIIGGTNDQDDCSHNGIEFVVSVVSVK